MEQVVHYLVQLINEERVQYGASELAWHEALATCSEQMCFELSNSHDINSETYQETLYQSCSRHQIYDHVTVNLGGSNFTDDAPKPTTEDEMKQLADSLHSSMISNDSFERRNMLDPKHTHIGIGLFISTTSIKLVELYANVYISLEIQEGEPTVSGKMLNEEYGPYQCLLFSNSMPSDDILDIIQPWQLNFHDGHFEFSLNSDDYVDTFKMVISVCKTRGTIPYDKEREYTIDEVDLVQACTFVFEPFNTKSVLWDSDKMVIVDIKLKARDDLEEQDYEVFFEDKDTGATLVAKKGSFDNVNMLVSDVMVCKAQDAPAGYEQITLPSQREESLVLCYATSNHAEVDNAVSDVKMSFRPFASQERSFRYSSIAVDEDDILYLGVRMVSLDLIEKDNGAPNDAEIDSFEQSFENGKPKSFHEKTFMENDEPMDEDETSDPGEKTVYENNKEKNADADADADEDEQNSFYEEISMKNHQRMTGDKSKTLHEEEFEVNHEQKSNETAAPFGEIKGDDNERKRLKALIGESYNQRHQLMKANSALQKSLALLLEKKQEVKDRTIEGVNSAENEKRYLDALNNVRKARDQLHHAQAQYDRVAMDLQSRLDEKEFKANEIQESFMEFKREIAKSAENSRTGKPIPLKVINQLETAETKKDQEVEKVRLKNINLKTHVKKLEQQLRAKEQLAEGLHLIDFEQLKIENQTLNEKIEERTEELHKLRKKTTTTVQVLTHIKEKLQFIQNENQTLKVSLSNLDEELSKERDQLTKYKKERDSLREQTHELKQKQGFVNSDLLVKDYDSRNEDIVKLETKVSSLKQRHLYLMQKSKDMKKRMQSLQPTHL